MSDSKRPIGLRTITAKWLQQNGYDGLFLEGGCACLITDLMPCREPSEQCCAGYKARCTKPDEMCESCADSHTGWHVQPDKPETT